MKQWPGPASSEVKSHITPAPLGVLADVWGAEEGSLPLASRLFHPRYPSMCFRTGVGEEEFMTLPWIWSGIHL